ncbi:hypothetical protein JOB18_013698 [Solea senegalensis]|uniref:Specifically androgen-regulated gene protein n=1 Tax=Solea senegalensis TaxID=28829 RepID=A0AAV6QPN1_SOLSE|nr:specifically androgen-regulated gene protein [Solea senegalensis]KAG7493636.1 hypothetical protein JOB18_013698 [Solea senegalensis]KAG7493637.1 hypothetical protein JOB18_013698 [Solea senegalensis]
MPKSDTWPGGVGLETSGMDSAGSCDSVVSANSGLSDDSLKHLSAEEKACLMFLEETIESLDTEEDSGLSNDELEQMSKPGNLVTDVADLSASMSKSKLSDLQNHASKEPIKENDVTEFTQNVPKSHVEARRTHCSVPSTNVSSKPQLTPSNKSNHKHNHKPPNVHFEVNVVTPPLTKPKDYPVRTAEGPIARGPLSYEALVYLQRSASTKKTPLCPTVDHTIELDKNLPGIMEGSSDRSHSKSKRSPPSVAPKPKVIPANISMKTQKETSTTSDYNIKHVKDPQVVRQEALQKLGLLKDQQPENEAVAPGSHLKSYSSLDPICERFTKGPGSSVPPRSPSFCYSQVPTQPKNRPLQSSASFHHSSRRDQQSASISHAPPSGGSRTAALEHSVTVNSPRRAGKVGDSTGSEPAPTKPSNSVEYTVMVVPGMGADRREALRKLGLLKQ